MQTSIKRRHRDRIVRRGLAMMIESDFYATAAGQRHFQQQLLSIRYCVQETCALCDLFTTCVYAHARNCSSRKPSWRSGVPRGVEQVYVSAGNFDVLFALLTCGNYDFRYDIQRGLRPARQLKTSMSHEVLMYAGAQVCLLQRGSTTC